MKGEASEPVSLGTRRRDVAAVRRSAVLGTGVVGVGVAITSALSAPKTHLTGVGVAITSALSAPRTHLTPFPTISPLILLHALLILGNRARC